jgi:hypothetical protein
MSLRVAGLASCHCFAIREKMCTWREFLSGRFGIPGKPLVQFIFLFPSTWINNLKKLDLNYIISDFQVICSMSYS